VRLGLARAAEVFLGDEPERVVTMLNSWEGRHDPSLPWLPGPLLDALAPLGIEVPKTTAGKRVARLLIGIGGDVTELDDAVDLLRDDAMATPAREVEAGLSVENDRALHEAVDAAVAAMVDAYGRLSDPVAVGDRASVDAIAEEAHRRMLEAAAPVDALAVAVTGARPERLTREPSQERPTIDLTAPWRYQPVRRRSDTMTAALAFLIVAVAAAAGVLWSVMTGTWP